MEDLTLLEVHGDQTTHTSDYFDQLYELAIKMIQSGNAYCDDTEQEKVIPHPPYYISSECPLRCVSKEEKVSPPPGATAQLKRTSPASKK